MPRSRKIPPAWLLGWGYFPFAVNNSVGIIAVPDLLASAHVPEARITTVTSLTLRPLSSAFRYRRCWTGGFRGAVMRSRSRS